MSTERPRNPPIDIEAAAAGIVGGTVIAVIANSLAEGSHLKAIIVLAIPTSTVIFRRLWKEGRVYLGILWANHVLEKQFEPSIDRLRALANEYEIEDEHREAIELSLKKIELDYSQALVETIDSKES